MNGGIFQIVNCVARNGNETESRRCAPAMVPVENDTGFPVDQNRRIKRARASDLCDKTVEAFGINLFVGPQERRSNELEFSQHV